MRETNFINQNKQKWDDFEQMLRRKDSDPDKMSELFVQVTDDLSYSRTFYPNRSVRVYLNTIAQNIFLSLYKNKKGSRGRFTDFWTDELPRIMYEGRKALLLSFTVFILFMGVGMLSSLYDPQFPEFIMGAGYMHMTEENIEKGDPMGVYGTEPEDTMFLRITFNNIIVSLYTFLMGVLASIGTLFILIRNAIMLGAFQQYFINKGLFTEMFFSVWVHGTLEISAIIIAGAAGLIFGSGLIIPGTYSRGQAFIQSARRGLKIIVGILPLFVIAGFIESFITRYTSAPLILRGAIILISLLFILFYYVYYPYRKTKMGFKERHSRDEIQANRHFEIDWGRIRSVGDVVAESFAAVMPFIGRFMMLGFVAGIVYGTIAVLVYPTEMGLTFNFDGSMFMIFNFTMIIAEIADLCGDMFQVYNLSDKPLFFVFNVAFWVLLFTLGLAVNRKIRNNEFQVNGLTNQFVQVAKERWLGIILFSTVVTLILSWKVGAWFGLMLPIILFFIGVVTIMDSEKTNGVVALKTTARLLKGHFFSLVGLNAILLMLIWLFVSLFCSMLFTFYLESIQLLFDFKPETMDLVTGFFTFVLSGVVMATFFAMMVASVKLLLISSKETNEAPDLLSRIEHLGTKKRVYGFEQEV
ncbi:hypothetical protein BH09BAC1_BH09BAC1_04680 [soil metagenome]